MQDELRKVYDPDGTAAFTKLLTIVNTDKVWAELARFTTCAFVAKGFPAYVLAAMRERSSYGTSYTSEILFVFDNLLNRNGRSGGLARRSSGEAAKYPLNQLRQDGQFQ